MNRKEYLKKYQKVYQKKRYEADKEKFKIKSDTDYKAKREWFEKEIIAKSQCLKCGNNHPGVLDFHHRDPLTKIREVSLMVHQKCSQKRILEEIQKCDVLCANCHRILHWEQRNKNCT